MIRRINLIFDVSSGLLRDSLGNPLHVNEYPTISFKENPIVNLKLVINSDLDDFTKLEVSDTYIATINDTYNTAYPMCKTENTGINQAGDWGDSGTADPTIGQISIRLNANNINFSNKILSLAEIPNTRLELKVFNGNVLFDVFSMPFRCLNTIDNSGVIPDPLPISARGDIALVAGADFVEVINLGLSEVPSQILVSISKPSESSSNIFGTVRRDSILPLGFKVDFSSEIPGIGYRMYYVALV